MKRRLAFVQLATVSMALRPADTAAGEPPKKVRRVTKKELRYLLKRLREADMSIFVAFVKQQVDERAHALLPVPIRTNSARVGGLIILCHGHIPYSTYYKPHGRSSLHQL